MKNTFLKFLKTVLSIIIILIFSNELIAQKSEGIFFQAIARDNYANPAKDRKIYVQSSIIQSNPTGIVVLTEEHRTNTDAAGMFSISLGNGLRIGGVANSLSSIDWSNGPFYLNLKVAITPVSGEAGWEYSKEWIEIGTTSFGAVPYALYSANTGGINQKLNLSDTTKMLSVYAKSMTVQSLATTVDTKLSSKDTIAMLAPYAKAAFILDSTYINTQLKSKLSIEDSSTKYITPLILSTKTLDLKNNVDLKLNKVDTSFLLQKADTITLSNRINFKLNANDNAVSATKLLTARNINGTLFDGTGDVTIIANAGTLTGTTLNASVVNSSLTSVGNITSGTWSGSIINITKGGTGSNNGSITGTSALNFSAGGTNQNVSILPSGSGSVGIGTISPINAAALDVTSSSQGFLPPRLNTSQRDLIISPVAGLTIWNSTNRQLEVYDGSYWVNMGGKLVSTLTVGQSYGGGIVAYILTSNDPGYVAKETHGLIAATTDQTSPSGIVWFPNAAFYGSTAISLGQGSFNTLSIVAVAGTNTLSSYAAGLANSYRDGSYSDWYLPSKEELNKLFINRVAIGGFASGGYWSSTQNGSLTISNIANGINSAWYQNFADGSYGYGSNATTKRVRAVRSF